MKSIRAAVFDIGGVLFFGPFSQAGSPFYEYWAERMRISSDILKNNLWYGPDIERANIGELTAEEYCHRRASVLEVDESLILEMIEEAFVNSLNTELVAYIRKLKPHLRIAALTNNWTFCDRLLEQWKISDLFEQVICSAEVGCKKPHLHIYEIMLARLQVLPEEVIFVDDSLENLETSHKLGFHNIQFISTEQTIIKLDALLDFKMG